MPDLAPGFLSLPPEFKSVIQLAQDQHHLSITPLQELAGGWSGAVIYLVSIAAPGAPVRHLILKLDLARLIHSLAYVAPHEGDTARAESQFRESLAMFRCLGNRRGIAECLAGLAGLRTGPGKAHGAATLLGAAAFAAAWENGRGLSLDQALRLAERDPQPMA